MEIKGFVMWKEDINEHIAMRYFCDSITNKNKRVRIDSNYDAMLESIEEGYIPVIFGMHNFGSLTKKTNTLVMERGYLGDRDDHFTIAWNGINGYGDHRFKPHMLHHPRYMMYPKLVEDRFNAGRRAPMARYLICGQVPTDKSLDNFIYKCRETSGTCLNTSTWNISPEMKECFSQDQSRAEIMKAVYVTIIAQIKDSRKYLGPDPIYFRKHPKDKTIWTAVRPFDSGFNDTMSELIPTSESLIENLQRHNPIVVSVNSNSLVEAQAWGAHTVAYDHEGSMVSGITYTDMSGDILSEHKQFNYLSRRQWFNMMTHSQWHIDEIAEGDMLNTIMS